MSETSRAERYSSATAIAPARRATRCIAARVAQVAIVALAALGPGAAGSALAADKIFTVDAGASSLKFLLDTTFHQVHGTMKVTGGTIRFDPSTGSASGTIAVDATSAETGNGRRDKTMHGDILESARFPAIVFKVERVEGALPGGTPAGMKLGGVMTLHGASHPVTLPATVRVEGGTVHAETRLTVPYIEWGLADPSFLFVRAAKTVEVSIVAQGTLADAP